MKKRILSLLLALVLLLTALPQMLPNASAATYSGTCGENLQWSYADGVLTISGTGAMTNYSYHSTAPCYSYRKSITSVQIEDNVTNIGNYAFHGCSILTSVTIGESVTKIGNSAFLECTALTAIWVDNSNFQNHFLERGKLCRPSPCKKQRNRGRDQHGQRYAHLRRCCCNLHGSKIK